MQRSEIILNLIKVKINNYKSIGSKNNTLILDPNVTAIVGKNESGKSNILEAIGKLPYINKTNNNYFNNKNRAASEDDKISVVFYLSLDEVEIDKFKPQNINTQLLFTNNSIAFVTGAFSEILAKDNDLNLNIETVVNTKGDRNVWNLGNNVQVKDRIAQILENLNEFSNIIFLNLKADISFLKKQLNRSYSDYKMLVNKIDEIFTSLNSYYSLFPRIYFRHLEQQLKYSYNYNEIKELLNNKDDIFNRLLDAAEISEIEILKAFEEKNEGDRQNIRRKIEEKISKNIGKKFNNFYNQEKVHFYPRIEGNNIKFFVTTNNGEQMLITERSDGLRWYISLFIDILAHDLSDSPVVFLLDEPGLHLHVNAQKEVLNFFNDLSSKGHKVIYTTHSPSMIDGNNLLNVRIVEKNDGGNTSIYNSYWDQRLSSTSKLETLSPLIKSIGYDLRFNLGPQYTLENIITEGITDYIYIKAMMNYLGVKEHPNIIPSAGVYNINRIASILIGWGCKFKILLDYDIDGKNEYDVLVNKLDPSMKDVITFVNGEDQPSETKMKVSPITMEDLISELDYNKLGNKLAPNKKNKKIVAKEFYDKVVNGQLIPEKETVESFKKLFRNLGIKFF